LISFIIYVHQQIIFQRSKEDERDSWTFGAYRKEKRCVQGFDGKLEGRGKLKVLGIEGRKISARLSNQPIRKR
jgi:hypothetical protein